MSPKSARLVRAMWCTVCCTALAVSVSLSPLHAQVFRLTAIRVAGGFSSPLFVTAPPNDFNRLFVVEQTGQIRIIDLSTNTVKPRAYLDLSAKISTAGEEGVLGLAFDPNYAANGRFFVNYVAPGGAFGQGVTHIARFSVSSNPDVADAASEVTVLTFDQPQNNHNAGWIGFSPRPGDAGNLYIASGDGGNANDVGPGHIEPGGNAQSTQTLLGKMLRIHLENSGAYTIPPNNPFAGSSTDRQEIWALGLRNPFRNSFDRKTGTLLIGDVGQSTREEIDVQKPSNPDGGENYGWRVREGFVQNPAFPSGPVPRGAVDPVDDYPHEVGQTVIGGYIYRGNQIPALNGIYVFADFLGPEGGDGTGRIFTFRYNGTRVSRFRDITAQLFPTQDGFTLSLPTSLGEDASGELYITDIGNGNIYKIAAVSR